MTIRVLLADDQPLVRAGFAMFINATPDMTIVGEAANGRHAVALARSTRPDVVVMDIQMPELDGLAATAEITADPELGGTHVLILTTFDVDQNVFQSLRAGASGFLGKTAETTDLLRAIRIVHRGEQLLSPVATRALVSRFLGQPEPATVVDRRLDALTDREREILTMVGLGLSNEDIASRLVLSHHTVKTHVNRAMTKLGAHDRAQLVIHAYEAGLVRPAKGQPR
ncbi:response regulator transcription factor [Asanoa sp. NPDC049518]|uniref:response regulator transcription factor n=1 Tax=unclassified Asanoa TaxID=2685164 RepID=UPI0034449173